MKPYFLIYRIYLKLFVFGILFLSSITISDAQDYQEGALYLKLADHFDLKFNTDSDELNVEKQVPFLSSFIKEFDISEVKSAFYFSDSPILKRTLRLHINQEERIDLLIAKLAALEEVEYAEKIPLDKIDYTPDDLGSNTLSDQWYLHRIKAPEAWDCGTGDPNIIVAIVDNAFQTDHIDLAGNFIPGWDVADNDNNPNLPNGSFTHGTHVAGLVGASTDNTTGIASIGFNISMMPVKAVKDNPIFNDPTFISHGYQGITWAADHGAHIINMSWGGYGSSITNQNVINYAYNKGVILVAAAANDNISSMFYPAAYDHVISVASTDENDIKSGFSNYGTWIDVSSPGNGNLSTIPYDGYAISGGTSMASPIVAGLCGLVWSVDPGLSPSGVTNCVIFTTDDIDALNPAYAGQLGSGRINAFKAMTCAKNCVPNYLLISPIDDYLSGLVYKVEADQSIVASNTIFAGADIKYDAGNKIELLPGFHAQNGSIFNAYIDGCAGLKLNGPGQENSLISYDNFAGKQSSDKNSSLWEESFNSRTYPNPFSDYTTIEFTLPESAEVSLAVFNTNGTLTRSLLNEELKDAGKYSISFGGRDLNPGIYIYTLQAGQEIQSGRMVLIK